MISFGEELKREREARKIRLSLIADETKIGVRFLEAIESGRLDMIPGRFYRRAYIRAYARYLGLDGERWVAAYEFATLADASSLPPRPSAKHPRSEWSRLPLAAAVKWSAVVIAGVGLSGAAAAVWRRAPEAYPTPSPMEAFRSATVRVNRELEATHPPFVREELEPHSPSPANVRLTLRVDEPCWLDVRTDGRPATEGVMVGGFEREFEAAEICLSLGNAGGLSYWIDGQAGRPLGQSGQVRKDVCITSENAADFVVLERR